VSQPTETSPVYLSAASCEGSAGITAPPRFARLIHDPQWMEWPSRMGDPDWPNGFYYDWYPETVKLYTGPRSGDGRLNYTSEWLEYLRELQPNSAAATWLTRVAAGLFNKGNQFIPILDLSQLKEEPVAESISTGGNVVKVLEIKNGAARIEMLFVRSGPPDISSVNYETKPWLISKFTSVSRDGEIGLADGQDIYFPNVAKQKQGYWVEKNRIELFPALPYCATIEGTLNAHQSPSIFSTVNGAYQSGQEVTVEEYLPQGSDVWGRTAQGWILLEHQKDGQPVYPTSWEMETRPPMVFD